MRSAPYVRGRNTRYLVRSYRPCHAAPPGEHAAKRSSMPTSTEALDIRHERTDRGHGSPSGLSRWQRLVISVLKGGPVPRHIAFIMDGNRRYAREHGMEVAEGHRMGYSKLEEALRWCAELGVSAVTVYAFSIENFKRTSRMPDGARTPDSQARQQTATLARPDYHGPGGCQPAPHAFGPFLGQGRSTTSWR